MANSENLKVPTSAEARINGKKGGIASGKARRERKAMREMLENLLALPLDKGTEVKEEDIKDLAALEGKNISVQGAILLAQIQKALAGDTKAAEYVRDTSGNKLKEGIELSGAVNNPFENLTTAELKKLIESE